MKSKLLTFTLISLVAVCLSSCKKQNKEQYNPIEKDEITYDGINLHYNFSDQDMTTFMNDFTHRNMRFDSDSCGEFPVAHGTGFAKNWEAMAVCFQNSVKQVYREDKFQKIAEYMIQIDQDDQGMIYNTPLVNEQPFSEAGVDLSGFSVPQGWPFPSWLNAVNNYLDMGNLDAVHTTEFNFNDGGHPQSKGWKVNNGTFYVGDNTGYAHYEFSDLSSSQTFEFYRDNLETLLPFSHGIDSRFSPMIDMEIEFIGTNLKDYNIIFKVEGDDNWHVAPQSLYASTPITNLNTYVHIRQFFDMYLDPEWNHHTITHLGVQFVGKEGKQFSVTGGKVNFIRPTYDTRQSNATYQFILALGSYFSYTRDMKTLIKLMPKARKGILFLNHALEGEKGLLSLEYLYGHDGVSPYCIEGKENDRLAYHGIGNGYGDLTLAPMINLEANNYYYGALKTMAYLEEAMLEVEGDNPSTLSIKNRMPGGDRVTYNYNKDSLAELAAKVKTNMEKPIHVERVDVDTTYNAGDYYYRNTGGLWNPETGRFCVGINEYNGKILDFGHVYLNLESVCAGIGTDEQQLEIMKWIDGQRIIQSDTSKGKDIYFYEFAPRFNTADCELNGGCYGFMQDENFYYRIYQLGYGSWSRQVQNGGAVIAWSYYDLVARTKVLGIDNALDRLEEIKKWYLKVLDYGGNGLTFYEDYYMDLDAEVTMDNPDMYMVYTLQASGKRGVGSLGLDSEFIESIIFIRSIPDALFGMDAMRQNNVLTFTYHENKKHTFAEIYNMKYGDAVYAYRTSKNVMQVFNINGQVNNKHKLSFRYKTDRTDLSVKVNGEEFKDVQYEGGYAVVTVPFGNTKVIFG